MDQIVAALLGAVVGGLFTGFAAWRLHRLASRDSVRRELALQIAQPLGELLSAYTPEGIKTPEEVYHLQRRLGINGRRLFILGERTGFSRELALIVNDYVRALIAHLDGNMKRGELEQRRVAAKEAARLLMGQLIRR